MSGFFNRASSVFLNSQNLILAQQKISDFQPFIDVRKAVFNIFGNLRDCDDENASRIKLQAWKLLKTIEISILPYNHDDLLLNEQLEILQAEAAYFPGLEGAIEKLCSVVKWLQANPVNPKRVALHQKLGDDLQSGAVGIVSKLTKGKILPGWGDRTLKELKAINRNCSFVESTSDIKSNLYDCLIIPSAGGSCPLMRTILTSYPSKELFLLYFDREKSFYSPRKSLPEGTMGLVGRKSDGVALETSEEDETWSVDAWVDDTYWTRMRAEFNNQKDSANHNEASEFLVRARLVTLGNSKTSVLREDHRLIEISALIDGRAKIDDSGKKFPRKVAKELKSGDLIVLRTTGSGDTLDDVAMSLMNRDGQTALISNALDWKEPLKQTFRDYRAGTLLVAKRLEERGHDIRDPNYMWIWTTEYVIRPESKSLFVDLIKIIHELDANIPDTDPAKYAEEKWNLMNELLRYRMKAGRRIRELLLGRLRQVIEKGDAISDEYHLSLAGVGGGELTVFRVSGVDSKVMSVPYNRTGIICEMKEN
jgi:hypothetical protein